MGGISLQQAFQHADTLGLLAGGEIQATQRQICRLEGGIVGDQTLEHSDRGWPIAARGEHEREVLAASP